MRAREQCEVRSHHCRYRAAAADDRRRRSRERQCTDDIGESTTQQEQQQESLRAQRAFRGKTEDHQEQHVADQVQPVGVHEQRCEQAHPRPCRKGMVRVEQSRRNRAPARQHRIARFRRRQHEPTEHRNACDHQQWRGPARTGMATIGYVDEHARNLVVSLRQRQDAFRALPKPTSGHHDPRRVRGYSAPADKKCLVPLVPAAQLKEADMSAGFGFTQMSSWQALAAALRGKLLSPGDVVYEERRHVWNGAIDRRPPAIAQCADAEDVGVAIKFCAREHLPMTVRGGGHNVAGLAVRDGALMLDLGPMNHVEVDAQARIARVEGGALWRDVDTAAQAHGLATTGGFVSTTGVGGYTLGGGVGWLMRRAGLAIDNLLEADVVLADGRSIVASQNQHADLFWGLRGGAGGLGVVTRFTCRLHPIHEVYAGAVFYPVE